MRTLCDALNMKGILHPQLLKHDDFQLFTKYNQKSNLGPHRHTADHFVYITCSIDDSDIMICLCSSLRINAQYYLLTFCRLVLHITSFVKNILT